MVIPSRMPSRYHNDPYPRTRELPRIAGKWYDPQRIGPPEIVSIPPLAEQGNGAVSQEKTEAVVLRGVDFSETSRIVTFLCPERGKLACLAKGARRKNSPLGAALDTFNRVDLVYYWKDGRGVQNLAEASILDGFGAVKRDLERSAHGAFALELAYKIAHENEPSAGLYAALVGGLEGLGRHAGNIRLHACWQAVRLLTAAGFAPVVEHCARCGGPVGERPGFCFSGGVSCRNCGADRALSPAAHGLLGEMLHAETACPAADKDAAGEVFALLRRYAAHQLETDFRSLRVLDEILG